MLTSRVDLHVHSQYSDRPSEWILRRIGAPECYTSPHAVYETARRRGMQFVTISDHNCIDGARAIAHLPGTFISNEITTYFPDDRCKVHVLCWGITERQFDDIQRARQHIVELRDYLHAEGIAHACAHPLYSVNDRLTVGHFEQLLVLFNVFESMNGARHRRGNDLVAAVLRGLTPEALAEMADRHGVPTVGEQPWVKGETGGSDDHSGVFIAKGYTVCPYTKTPKEFLAQVMARESRAAGLDGTPLSFAHSLYRIGYQYYRDRFFGRGAGGGDDLLKVFGDVFGAAEMRVRFRDRVSYCANRVVGRTPSATDLHFRRTIATEMQRLTTEGWTDDAIASRPERHDEINRRTFELASRVANQLLFQFTRRFAEKLTSGSVVGSIEALSAVGPVVLGISPYLFAFAHQNRDRQLLATISQRFLGRAAEADAPPRRAWFTDTVHDVNGVTRLVRSMGEVAADVGDDLTLVAVAEQAPAWPGRVKHFSPVGRFTIPEHEDVVLAFPPFLDVLDYCDREGFTELIVSTPGLSGLAALAVARTLNIRVVGVFHTDLPQYGRYHTDDEALEGAAWTYLRWFYEQMDVIYVPSGTYARQLAAKGFPAEKLRPFPHGVDPDRFHPRLRDEGFWRERGVTSGAVVTYVGRVVKEKDLDVLVDAFNRIRATGRDCTLAIIGDGAYLPEVRARLAGAPAVFTGFLFDDELGRAYASSDVFVFPSTTDTFGNVVLEAMASGLPVVVTDRGGPAEIVEHDRSGLIVRGRHAGDLAAAIGRLLDDAPWRATLGQEARRAAEGLNWRLVYQRFWGDLSRAATGAASDRSPHDWHHGHVVDASVAV